MLPVCFLLKGYLKDRFSFDSVNLGTGWGSNQKACIVIQLCHLLMLCSEGTICHLCLSLSVCKKIINVTFAVEVCYVPIFYLLASPFLNFQAFLCGKVK